MRAKRFYRSWIVWMLVLASGILIAARLDLDIFDRYNPLDKESYLTREQILFIRPGLELEILNVFLPEDLRVEVTYSIKDPMGLPLDRDGIFTPGPVSASFLVARIPVGSTQYESYITRTVTSSITGESAVQATSDSGGSTTKVEEGVYLYKFGSALPEDFDPDAVHTVGIYASRDLRDYGLDRYSVNTVVSGPGARDVVRTETCNQCHNPLAIHGGRRTEVQLCVMCHTPQSTDPDTGNTVDMKVMIHKIHMGADLPSVQAGTPYQIIGFRNSVHDYSEVEFPPGVMDCESCHTPGADVLPPPDEAVLQDVALTVVGGDQSSAYLMRPSRAVCGSCHDDVNFETGEGHIAGPQLDLFCNRCHPAEGEMEFDASVKGAHTLPYKSKQLKGLKIEIVDVSNAGPGQSPTVFYRIAENDGTPVALSDMNRVVFLLAGPTTDYTQLARETATEASVPFMDGYNYTFEASIPEGATGTYAVGVEGRRDVAVDPGPNDAETIREFDQNSVFYFGVTDAPAVPRRQIVTDEKCESCHRNLELHGGNRHNATEYCQMCHSPVASDVAVRPEEDLPVESIHFKYLIHRVHRGHELTRDFTVFGFRSSIHNYNELHFPGDLRDCESCHVNDSYTLPLPEEALPTTETPREFFSPLPPAAAACLSCHDSAAAAAHVFTQIAPFGEACAACHGTGADFSVERVHAR